MAAGARGKERAGTEMGLTQGSQNPEKVTLSKELTGMKGRPLQVSGEDTPGPGTSKGPRAALFGVFAGQQRGQWASVAETQW